MQCDGGSGLFISVSGFGAAVPAAGENAQFRSSKNTKHDLCLQTLDDFIHTLQNNIQPPRHSS